MSDPILTASGSITFEDAIAFTQTLLQKMGTGELSDAELEAAIASLVQTENGARGFFVTYLTDPQPFADQPIDAVLHALQASPAIVAELLVKNLAMSSAMAITHRRNQKEEMAQGSDRVRSRTTHLMQRLQLPEVTERATRLYHSALHGDGDYRTFLTRWNYDDEQLQTIQQVLKPFLADDQVI